MGKEEIERTIDRMLEQEEVPDWGGTPSVWFVHCIRTTWRGPDRKEQTEEVYASSALRAAVVANGPLGVSSTLVEAYPEKFEDFEGEPLTLKSGEQIPRLREWPSPAVVISRLTDAEIRRGLEPVLGDDGGLDDEGWEIEEAADSAVLVGWEGEVILAAADSAAKARELAWRVFSDML